MGDIILERQMTLFGHVLRREHTHLMRQVTCDNNLIRPHQLYKRSGQPRHNWVEDNLRRAHEWYGENDGPFDINSEEHANTIKNAARDDKF